MLRLVLSLRIELAWLISLNYINLVTPHFGSDDNIEIAHLFGCLWVVWILVWVTLQCQLAVGLLNIVASSCLSNPQD